MTKSLASPVNNNADDPKLLDSPRIRNCDPPPSPEYAWGKIENEKCWESSSVLISNRFIVFAPLLSFGLAIVRELSENQLCSHLTFAPYLSSDDRKIREYSKDERRMPPLRQLKCPPKNARELFYSRKWALTPYKSKQIGNTGLSGSA